MPTITIPRASPPRCSEYGSERDAPDVELLSSEPRETGDSPRLDGADSDGAPWHRLTATSWASLRAELAAIAPRQGL